MDSIVKRKWIEALRSGEYSQGKESLRDGNGNYCCLGVLAEIQGVPREKTTFMDCSRYTFAPDYKCTASIPTDYLGITSSQRSILINMNDYYRNSFPEIADFIENNL